MFQKNLRDVLLAPPGGSKVVMGVDPGFRTGVKLAVIDGTGKYVMPGIPPGEYLMTAVTDIEPGEQFDPAFLELLSRSAIALTIGDGEKKTQDLRLAAQR